MAVTQEHIDEAMNTFGTSKSSTFINKLVKHGISHGDFEYINDPKLLTLAIRANDGEAITALLVSGCELNQQNIDYATNYATYGGRPPFAYDAISSWIKINELISEAEKLNRSYIVLATPTMAEENKKVVQTQKNLPPDALIPFYHGTKGQVSESSLSFISQISESGYYEERSGPGLKCVSAEGGFWYGTGFKIEIPRKLVQFYGEDNPQAVVKIEEDGITHVLKTNKQLRFDEFKTTFLVNIHPVFMVKTPDYKIPSTYFPNEEGNFDATFHELSPSVKPLISDIIRKMNVHENKRVNQIEDNKDEGFKAINSQDVSSKILELKLKHLNSSQTNKLTP